jgi:hypothetical protein
MFQSLAFFVLFLIGYLGFLYLQSRIAGIAPLLGGALLLLFVAFRALSTLREKKKTA